MPRFEDLPLEVRIEIYRYALAFTPSFHEYDRCEFLEAEHGLRKLARPLLTSKWIRAEATPVLFEANEAHITCALGVREGHSPASTGWATCNPTADCNTEDQWSDTTLRRFSNVRLTIQFDEPEDWRTIRHALRTFCARMYGGRLAHLRVMVDSQRFERIYYQDQYRIGLYGPEPGHLWRGNEEFWSRRCLDGQIILRGLYSLGRLHGLSRVDFVQVPHEAVAVLRPHLLDGYPDHLRRMADALTHRHLRGPGDAFECALDEHDGPAFRALRERYLHDLHGHLRGVFQEDPEP